MLTKTKSINKQAILLYFISILFFISITAFDPFISTYASELGFNPGLIGSIVGAAGIASMLTRFPVGIISDFLHNKKIMIQIGLLITIVAWSIAFFSPSAMNLYIAKIADGVTGATWVIYNIMFVSFFKKEDAAKAVGILAVVSPVGSLIGSFIGGIIANIYGYKYSFLVAVISALFALILTLFLKESKNINPGIKYDKNIVKEQLSDKYIWLLGILGIISMMVPYATRDTFTPIIAKELGADAMFITLLSNIHMISNGIAASLSGGYFNKKFGLVNTAIIGAIGQGIVAIMIPFSTSLTTILILQTLAGFMFGLNFTVLTSLSIDKIDASKQSTRMGLFQSIYSIGMFFGPMIIGTLIQNMSQFIGFLFIGIMSILSGIYTLKINKYIK